MFTFLLFKVSCYYVERNHTEPDGIYLPTIFGMMLDAILIVVGIAAYRWGLPW